jgi:hypothetical protein
VTLFFVDGATAALVGWNRLRSRWLDAVRMDAGGLESLPDFIALPWDEEGRLIIPTSRVTALVEAREAWATELGTLDAVNRSITRGQLVMPRVSAPSQQTVLRNRLPLVGADAEAKRALGPVIAMWLASSVLKYVTWNNRLPILLHPYGEQFPRARLRFIDSSRTLASPTRPTLIGVSRIPLPRSSAAR